MIDLSAQTIRAALAALNAGARESGGFFPKQALEKELGALTRHDKGRLRDNIKHLFQKGALVKSDDGRLYRYIPEAVPPGTPEEGWARVYRAARAAKDAMSACDIAKVVSMTPTGAGVMLKKMLSLDYLSCFQAKEGTYYRATQLLRDTPEVPLLPRSERRPLITARKALADLNHLFLVAEITSGPVQEKARELTEIILKELGGKKHDSQKN